MAQITHSTPGVFWSETWSPDALAGNIGKRITLNLPGREPRSALVVDAQIVDGNVTLTLDCPDDVAAMLH